MTAAATSHATRRHAYRASIRRNVRAFWSNRPAVVGVVLIVLFGVMAVLHPILRATIWQNQMYDPLFGFDFDVLHPSSPSLTHWLGTDTLGRDVASQLLAATGTTWVLAVTTAVVATFVGAVGSYYRGPTDLCCSTRRTVSCCFRPRSSCSSLDPGLSPKRSGPSSSA